MADCFGPCVQVLDTLCYADRTLLADNAVLAGATVFVHLSSHVKVRAPFFEAGSLVLWAHLSLCNAEEPWGVVWRSTGRSVPLMLKSRMHLPKCRHTQIALLGKRARS